MGGHPVQTSLNAVSNESVWLLQTPLLFRSLLHISARLPSS